MSDLQSKACKMTGASPFETFVPGTARTPLQARSIWAIYPKAAVQQAEAALADAAVSTRGSEAQVAAVRNANDRRPCVLMLRKGLANYAEG